MCLSLLVPKMKWFCAVATWNLGPQLFVYLWKFVHFSAHLALKGDFYDVPPTLQIHNCRSSKQSDFAGKWTKYLEIPKKEGRMDLGGAVQVTDHYFGQGHVLRTRLKIDWKFHLFLDDFLGCDNNVFNHIFECHSQVACQVLWLAARMDGTGGLFRLKEGVERARVLAQLVCGVRQNRGVSSAEWLLFGNESIELSWFLVCK